MVLLVVEGQRLGLDGGAHHRDPAETVVHRSVLGQLVLRQSLVLLPGHQPVLVLHQTGELVEVLQR